MRHEQPTQSLVGESWISEHYFTTDANSKSFHARVMARRKAWDEQDAYAKEQAEKAKKAGQEPGETAVPARSRFLRERGKLLDDFIGLAEQLDRTATWTRSSPIERTSRMVRTQLYERLLAILGITDSALKVETDGPLRRVRTPGIEGHPPLVIVSAYPVLTVEDLVDRHTQTLADAVRAGGGRAEHRLGRATGLGTVHRRRGTGAGAGARRPVGDARRAGTLGRGPVPRHRPAAGAASVTAPHAVVRSTAR